MENYEKTKKNGEFYYFFEDFEHFLIILRVICKKCKILTKKSYDKVLNTWMYLQAIS
jgi:hypothetical protein